MDLVDEFLKLPPGKGRWRTNMWKEFNAQCDKLDDGFALVDDDVSDFGGWLLGEVIRLRQENSELTKIQEQNNCEQQIVTS